MKVNQCPFELACGGIIGRDHRIVPKNNQDSFSIASNDFCTVGIVTDGCGSEPFSEVGAHIGASLFSQAVLKEVTAAQSNGEDIRFDRVQEEVEMHILTLARSMNGRMEDVILKYFLFTVVGFVCVSGRVLFFALGDGVIVVNGEALCFGHVKNNQPPYLAYNILPVTPMRPSSRFSVQVVLDTCHSDVSHFLIGTDGVLDIPVEYEKTLPGLDQSSGVLSQFWENDKFFENPDMVRRRLALMARDWPKINPQPGFLHDDTTLIVGRLLQPDSRETDITCLASI